MSLTVAHICEKYFSGFQDLSHFKLNSAKENGVAALKVASYFLLIVPLSFAIVYGVNSLIGRVKKKPSPSAQDRRIQSPASVRFSPTPTAEPSTPSTQTVGTATTPRADEILSIKARVQSNQIPTETTLIHMAEEASRRDVEGFFNPPITPVISGLYLGTQRNVGVIPHFEKERKEERKQVLNLLQSMQIKTIVTCCEAISQKNRFDQFTYQSYGFGDRPDNPEFLNQLPRALRSIHDARSKGENVLIHCNAGASRSASVVIAYLMVLGLTYDEALRYLKNQRLVVAIGNFSSALQNLDLVYFRRELGIDTSMQAISSASHNLV